MIDNRGSHSELSDAKVGGGRGKMGSRYSVKGTLYSVFMQEQGIKGGKEERNMEQK
jgi:hypothetical protein